MPSLIPRRPVPELDLTTTAGEPWRLAERKPKSFSMLVFYRGLHCPICAAYLRDLDGRLDEFAKRGVDVVAASTDSEERAEGSKERWGLERLTIGHGLNVDKAREWGLYISTGRGKTSAGVEEPARFNEPGIFLVKPDGTLYWSSVSTMPFARPSFADILKAIDFVVDKNYPARGEA